MRHEALLPATEEMRDCYAFLATEMLHWPGVKMYHLFGTRAFYHRKVMYAMLPDKRSLDSVHAISFKSSTPESEPQDSWHTFELTDRGMIQAALASLEKAYHDSKLAVASPLVTAGR